MTTARRIFLTMLVSTLIALACAIAGCSADQDTEVANSDDLEPTASTTQPYIEWGCENHEPEANYQDVPVWISTEPYSAYKYASVQSSQTTTYYDLNDYCQNTWIGEFHNMNNFEYGEEKLLYVGWTEPRPTTQGSCTISHLNVALYLDNGSPDNFSLVENTECVGVWTGTRCNWDCENSGYKGFADSSYHYYEMPPATTSFLATYYDNNWPSALATANGKLRVAVSAYQEAGIFRNYKHAFAKIWDMRAFYCCHS